MKTKTATFISIFILFGMMASATTIIVSGCTKPRKYSRVEYMYGEIVCTGNGNIQCPTNTIYYESPVHEPYSLDDIICFVFTKISLGEKNSECYYKDAIKVRWTSIGDEAKIEVDGVSVDKRK